MIYERVHSDRISLVVLSREGANIHAVTYLSTALNVACTSIIDAVQVLCQVFSSKETTELRQYFHFYTRIIGAIKNSNSFITNMYLCTSPHWRTHGGTGAEAEVRGFGRSTPLNPRNPTLCTRYSYLSKSIIYQPCLLLRLKAFE